MEFLGQFPLIPEILGYRISHWVRARMPDSVQIETTFGRQRIGDTSSRLAPRYWRSLSHVTVYFLRGCYLSKSADRHLDSAGDLQRHHGGTDDDRLDYSPPSVTNKPLGFAPDDPGGRTRHPISGAVARNGVWGHCDDGYRPHLGEGVAGFSWTRRRVLLPSTWGRSRYRLECLGHVVQCGLRLGNNGTNRWSDGLRWHVAPACFQTVDNPVRPVSRRGHNRHARNSGHPMRRGGGNGYSLRDLKAGGNSAWSWLVAEFSGKIVGYATRMGARDPEEVMSATLETVATRIADFEGNESQMRSFIFSIAHARIVDDLRKATRRSEVSIENTLSLLEADEPNEDTFSDPDLLNALSRLPEDQRRMLELRYVVGLSTKETADAIAKSEVATRVGLSRAFARLKELLVDDLRNSSEEVPS